MATASPLLISILRTTADRIENGAEYRWTHQGRCNCGQLIQTATGLGAAEIRKRAMEKPGEWSEHAVDYCPVSNHPLDDVIDALREIGFAASDLASVEYLNNARICREAKKRSGKVVLDYRNRDDVILYFRTWADQLEEELGEKVTPEKQRLLSAERELPVLPEMEPGHGNPHVFTAAPTITKPGRQRDSLPQA